MSPFYLELLEELGEETDDANRRVYLGTVSRVLPGARAAAGYRDVETLTKAELVGMVRDAFDNPLRVAASAGRPRARSDSPIDLVIAVKEQHADGSSHFHFAVKLFGNHRLKQAKLVLSERHLLPSHWSCTHTQLWSAVRYMCVPSMKKPSVDGAPAIWTFDGRDLDLMELSREPFVAAAWRKRRELNEVKALVDDSKAPAFNKLDFTALILSSWAVSPSSFK